MPWVKVVLIGGTLKKKNPSLQSLSLVCHFHWTVIQTHSHPKRSSYIRFRPNLLWLDRAEEQKLQEKLFINRWRNSFIWSLWRREMLNKLQKSLVMQHQEGILSSYYSCKKWWWCYIQMMTNTLKWVIFVSKHEPKHSPCPTLLSRKYATK